MSTIISKRLEAILEKDEAMIEGQIYYMIPTSSTREQIHVRLRSKKDLLDLSDMLREDMILRKAVPYRICLTGYQHIRLIDDDFFQGIPWVKIVYSSVLLYQEILKTGGRVATLYLNRSIPWKMTLRDDRQEIIDTIWQSGHDITVRMDTGDFFILKSPGNGLGVVKNGPVRFLVAERSGKRAEITMEGDGKKSIKDLIDEYLSTQGVLPDSIFTDDSESLGTKILGVQAQRGSIDDMGKIFDLTQLIQDMLSYWKLLVTTGFGTKAQYYVDVADLSRVILGAAKTNDRLSISSVGLDTDFYIFLT